MSDIESRGYADPGVLVSTDWVADHLRDRGVRLVESNEDPLVNQAGRIGITPEPYLSGGPLSPNWPSWSTPIGEDR